uniref:Uncharacterized protein n=1 Tax=Aegilops tauschii subsp. strangulata TaxID=200361 RepID=A0A453K4B1_AEGTS
MKWRQSFCRSRDESAIKAKRQVGRRFAILYGTECWPTKSRHVQQLGVMEMRMLRWMYGHTRNDRAWNDDIRDRVGVTLIEEKLVQHRV